MSECRTCKHYHPMDEQQGFCRGNFPTAILVGHLPPKMVGQNPVPFVQSFFPPMMATGGCGQHTEGKSSFAPLDLSKIDLTSLANTPAEGEA